MLACNINLLRVYSLVYKKGYTAYKFVHLPYSEICNPLGVLKWFEYGNGSVSTDGGQGPVGRGQYSPGENGVDDAPHAVEMHAWIGQVDYARHLDVDSAQKVGQCQVGDQSAARLATQLGTDEVGEHHESVASYG